jgi:hypothetical protein
MLVLSKEPYRSLHEIQQWVERSQIRSSGPTCSAPIPVARIA